MNDFIPLIALLYWEQASKVSSNLYSSSVFSSVLLTYIVRCRGRGLAPAIEITLQLYHCNPDLLLSPTGADVLYNL